MKSRSFEYVSVEALAAASVMAVGAAGFAGVAHSQDTHSQDTYSQDTGALPARVEEVVVTARKREETASRVPEAIAVVSGAALESRGITSLQGMPALVPSFSFNQFQDAATVYMSIRGVNSVRTGEPPVAMVVDGVQINDPSQINQELSDVERIEILKGPQGSLYGRNAIGGAINIVTRKPVNQFESLVRATYKNGNDRKIEGVLSGPVSDKVLFRVGGGLRDFDGVIKNTFLNRDVGGARDGNAFAKLSIEPSDTLTMDLRATHFQSDYDSYYYKLAGIGRTNHEEDYDVRSSSLAPSKRQFDDVAFKVDADLNGVQLTSITGYSRSNQYRMGDLDFTPAQALEVGQRFLNEAVSEEIRLASTAEGRLQWVGGVFYLDKKQRLTDATYAGPDLVPGVTALPAQLNASFGDFFGVPSLPGTLLYKRTDFRFKNTAYAAFGQADYELSPTLKLTAGLRYDVERREALNPAPTRLLGAPVEPAADVAPRRQKNFQALQPKLTLSYTPEPGQLYYGTVSRGFRSGGFNNTLRPEFATYKPESLWNFETGAKLSLFDGRVRVEGAVFYMDYQDRQDFFFNAVDVTQNIFNIDESRIQGAELSVHIRATDGLSFTGGIGLLDTKITKFDAARLRAIDPDPSHTAVGHHFSYVYHTSADLSAQYETALNDEIGLSVGVDYSYKARNWWWFTNLEQQKALNIVNARVALTWRAVEVKLVADNLFNLSYVTSHDPSYAFGFPEDDVYPAEPRRYGIAVTTRF